jgi:hypothetical protein
MVCTAVTGTVRSLSLAHRMESDEHNTHKTAMQQGYGLSYEHQPPLTVSLVPAAGGRVELIITDAIAQAAAVSRLRASACRQARRHVDMGGRAVICSTSGTRAKVHVVLLLCTAP